METILVTGGCGYLGSQLIRQIRGRESHRLTRVRILDNLQSGETRALMDLPDGGPYEFMQGDLMDPSVLRLALREVDAVVHLAAVVHTPFSFEDPNWVEQVNHWGTSHLVEACLSAGVERFVFASSAAVYGPGGPFDEEAPCRPNGAYAHSKRQAERTVLTAADRGLRPTVLRIGTLFGEAPVTRFDAVANKFVRLAGVGKPLTIHGKGDQRRPFVHVRDAADALLWALERSGTRDGEVFNVLGDNLSIRELVEAIEQSRPEVRTRSTEQDIRTHLSVELDGSRIWEEGWSPSVSIAEGLGELLEKFGGFEAPNLSGGLSDEL